MAFSQAITPNPNIACTAGWCLKYVQDAFGAPAVYGTATAAWEGSASQHADWNFPADCWVPVWFSLANEPAGHVALRAPDGSVYSTSDLGNTPHHHASLDDLMGYYTYYGMPLAYLGWTEDVEGTPVVTPNFGTITDQGTITSPTEGFLMALNDQDQQNIYEAQGRIDAGVAKLVEAVAKLDAIQAATANIPLGVLTAQFRTKTGAVANVASTLAELLAKPAAVTNASGAPALDVDALVARLKAELPAAIRADLAAKLTQP